ncbi:MAG: histidine phosphatase family protein [Chloroflexi bacterium]|nr:histidine phosphatase family protein [Chloroflexota bacterium]
MTTTIELIPHLDAGDRALWRGDQNLRPLSDLGRRQAESIAAALAAGGSIDSLYASPALRCVQTLEPLAVRLGISVEIVPDLIEGHLDEDRLALGERCLNALRSLVAQNEGRRVVACSHGDLVPGFAEHVVSHLGVPDTHRLERRGQWYTVRLDPDAIAIELNLGPDDFPR